MRIKLVIDITILPAVIWGRIAATYGRRRPARGLIAGHNRLRRIALGPSAPAVTGGAPFRGGAAGSISLESVRAERPTDIFAVT